MTSKRTRTPEPSATAEPGSLRPADPVPFASAGEAVAEGAPAEPAASSLAGAQSVDLPPAVATAVEVDAAVPVAIQPAATTEDEQAPCAHAWERGRLDGKQTYHCPRCGAHKPR